MSTSKDGMHILPTILHIHGKTANKTTHHKFSSSIIKYYLQWKPTTEPQTLTSIPDKSSNIRLSTYSTATASKLTQLTRYLKRQNLCSLHCSNSNTTVSTKYRITWYTIYLPWQWQRKQLIYNKAKLTRTDDTTQCMYI